MKIIKNGQWYRRDDSEFWWYAISGIILVIVDIFFLTLILR